MSDSDPGSTDHDWLDGGYPSGVGTPATERSVPSTTDPMPSIDRVPPTAPVPPASSASSRPVGPGGSADPSGASERPAVSAESHDQPSLRPQHARRRRNYRIIVWSSVVLLVLVVASSGLLAAQRIDRPLPQPTVAAGRITTSVVPESSPAPPWPAGGQAALAIPALGYAEQSGPEQPVPIASLAKMTAAVVVLRDHPVPLGSSGPTVTNTSDEANQFDVDLANNETNIPLLSGETLTELQLLEALLVQSANDAAYTLAVWDSGSQPAFVAKMNGLAVSLCAVHSHCVDASGFDPQSESTAADTLRIATTAPAQRSTSATMSSAFMALRKLGGSGVPR